MDLTLLTCTCNGARTMPLVLEAYARQRCGDARFEVLVVDNASTDGTAELARSLIASLGLPGRVVREERLGKMNAFLTGLEIAQAPLISVIDDDNVICEEFVQRSVEWFRNHPELGMIGSRNFPAIEQAPDWFRQVMKWYACAPPSIDEIEPTDETGPFIGDSAVIAGAGSTFRKAPLLGVLEKGYQFFNDARRGSATGGEDIELCLLLGSLGFRFAYDPKIALAHHIDPQRLSWDSARRHARSIGAAMLGIDPFFLTAPRVLASRVSKLRNTWQWQAVARMKRLLRMGTAPLKLVAGKHVADMTVLHAELEWAALRRILRERGRYTEHLRRVGYGKWTELRVR